MLTVVEVRRPDWADFVQKTAGAYLYCACGHILYTFEAVRAHWEAGHFDQKVVLNDECEQSLEAQDGG